MKRLFFAVVLLLFVVQVNAQSKSAEAVLKTLEKVKKDVQHPKKGNQPATFLKLSSAYDACYDTPIAGIWQGANQQDIKLLLKDQQILSSTQVEKGGKVFNVDKYEDKDLYYDANGVLLAWVITKPIISENPLNLSYEALLKAHELDTKGKSASKISAGLSTLKSKFTNEGMSYYNLGDNVNASKNFEATYRISGHPTINIVDTVMAYYAGVTAFAAGDVAKSIELLNVCINNKYEQNGDVYATLAEAYKKSNDTLKAKETLVNAFSKYPTNQSILVTLVNLYTESKESPDKILELLKIAQKNEPTNASLFYAEGNVLKNLNRTDEAVACYQKSFALDPTYVYAPFGEGSTYYDKAVEIQEVAQNEMDQAKYEALIAKMESYLEKAIAPFEKAFSIAKDPQVKLASAEYLKNIYFRFREKAPSFQENYDKYNKYFQEQK